MFATEELGGVLGHWICNPALMSLLSVVVGWWSPFPGTLPYFGLTQSDGYILATASRVNSAKQQPSVWLEMVCLHPFSPIPVVGDGVSASIPKSSNQFILKPEETLAEENWKTHLVLNSLLHGL